MSTRLVTAHLRWMLLELLRQPSYIVSTMAFPALFYLIFAIPESKTVQSSNFLMASFSGFAFFGVVFLQFGVALAQERTHSWYQFIRTLPVTAIEFFLARFLAALLFAALAAGLVCFLAVGLTEAHLGAEAFFWFGLTLAFGALPFCLMGLALGYWATEKTSLPLGNLIYLPLSFVGGLWKPPEILPGTLREISAYLPTRYYGNMLWNSVKGTHPSSHDVLGLCAYGLLAAGIAWLGFRRDSERRLR